jgi:hypothetical protein
MSETNRTPGPWRYKHVDYLVDNDNGTYEVTNSDSKYHYWIAHTLKESDARLIAAAPDLLEAAKLTVLAFNRANTDDDTNWLGDDEHEAWTALSKAVDKAEGR